MRGFGLRLAGLCLVPAAAAAAAVEGPYAVMEMWLEMGTKWLGVKGQGIVKAGLSLQRFFAGHHCTPSRGPEQSSKRQVKSFPGMLPQG